jgi:hypothetical protein
MRWVVRVTCIGEVKITYSILIEDPEGKKHLEDRDVDGKIILKWILRK